MEVKSYKVFHTRRRKWPIIGIILLISALLIIWYVANSIVILIDDWDHIYLDQEKFRDGWLIKVTYCHNAYKEGDGRFSLDVFYFLINHPNNETKGWVKDINGRFNEDGTIIFFDIDDNNQLNKGDIFLIMDNSESRIKPGDIFTVYLGSIELN